MRRIAATAALSVLGLGLGAGPALAGGQGPDHGHHGHGHHSPWMPYHQEDALVTAGRSTCGFDVQETVVSDVEEYRTTKTFSDGTPREQVFRGDLVMRFTNVSTGTNVVHDLGGTGVFVFNADGSPASLTSRHGPFGTTLPTGSTPFTGIYVVSGKGTAVTFNADDTRTLTLGRRGTAIDVCAELD